MVDLLIKFWVQNYRRFWEKVELDFTDKKNYQFGKGCVRGDFLEKVVILGNNGSGKTSFGYALVDIVSMLTDLGIDVGQNNTDCFINGFGGSDVAKFHYEFSHRGSTITYEYGKSTPSTIVSETFYIDRDVVFRYDLRDMDGAVFNLGIVGVSDVKVGAPDGSRALLRTIGEKAELDRISPVRSVLEFARNSLYYMAMWKLDVHIGYIGAEDNIESYIVGNGLVDDLQRFLSDECGTDVTIGESGGRLVVRTEVKEIPFFQAVSRGTAILCRLYCWNKRSSDKEAIVFFDDFDDLFDHRTAERVMTRIIRNSQAQCIFVTHNIGLISSDSLRPDCCFILHGGSLRSLSSLTEKSIRRGHNLEKMLRDGEFNLG